MNTFRLTVLLSVFMISAVDSAQPGGNKTLSIIYAREKGYCNASTIEEVDDVYRSSLFLYDGAMKKFSTPCKDMYGVTAYTWHYRNCNSTNNPLRITYEEMCIYPLPEILDIMTIDEGADDQPQGISNNTEAAHDTDQIVTPQNSTVEVEAKPPTHEITTTTHEVTIEFKVEESPPNGEDSAENNGPLQEYGLPVVWIIVGSVCAVIAGSIIAVIVVKKTRKQRPRQKVETPRLAEDDRNAILESLMPNV